MQTNIYISEIFGPTIQGEGKRIGKVSLFIRVAKCNMSCTGFGVEYKVNGTIKTGCDSFYAVDKSFKSKWESLDSTQIIKRVQKLTKLKKVDIVITGGEPLLYWKNNQFQTLLKYFTKNKHFVTIETNGSINIDITKKYQKKIMFSIGLKLENSLEKQTKRIDIKAIKNLLKNGNNSYLKFATIANNHEISEILEIKKSLNINKNKIYLMPMGATNKDIKNNAIQVIQKAIKYHFNYSDRIHIRIWDTKRKV